MPLFQSKARCGLKVRKSNGLFILLASIIFKSARESTSSCKQLFSTLRLLPR